MNNELHVILGTGPLGQSIMRELLKRGKTVKMVNRSGKRPADVPATVEVVASDVYDADKVRAATTGAVVVYQCAQPAYTEWVEKFPPLMKSVLEGLTDSGAKLIIGENLYMYGDTDGQPLHEGLPYDQHTRKGKVRGEVAQMALDAHRAGKVRVAIGRGADFYGPGVLDSLTGERAILPALEGKAGQLAGNIDLPHTLTYIEDFGKALAILGEGDEALGQVWHVPNPPTISQRQWMTMVFEELGKPPKMSGVSRLMMTIAGLFVPAAREIVEMMYEFEKPYIVDHSKFRRTFGEAFGEPTPHREAVRRTVAWYRAHAAQQAKAAGRTATAIA
jgi:nucleoside-diphosphate-sugar epimerase